MTIAQTTLDSIGANQIHLLSISHPMSTPDSNWINQEVAQVMESLSPILSGKKVKRAQRSSSHHPLPLEAQLMEAAGKGDFNEQALAAGWSDGLPLIAPRPERVAAFTPAHTEGIDEIVAHIPPTATPVTVQTAAIYAIMAGCAPEYLPVLIAAVRAVTATPFSLPLIQATTSAVTPMIVANGPLTRQIGMNSDTNALGQGWRANATIGRALRLLLQNHGQARPGQTDMATLGQPGKITFCFAENEALNSWRSLAQSQGGHPDQDYVTAIPANGVIEIRDSDSESAEDLLTTVSSALILPALIGPSGKVGIESAITVLLCPEHAHILSSAGLSKEDVQKYLWQRAKVKISELAPSVQSALESAREQKSLPVPVESIPMVERPEDLLIVVAGGPGRKSAVVPGWGSSRPVTMPVGHRKE